MASKEGALASAWKAGAQQSLGASSGKGEEKASGLSAVSEPLPPAPPSEGTTASGLPGPFPWPKAPSYPLRSPHSPHLNLASGPVALAGGSPACGSTRCCDVLRGLRSSWPRRGR